LRVQATFIIIYLMIGELFITPLQCIINV